MKHSLSLRVKLIITLISVGLISIIIPGAVVFYQAKKNLETANINLLKAIREEKKLQVEKYFSTIRNQILTFSEDLMVIQAMHDFQKGFANYHQSKTQADIMKKTVDEFYKTEFLPRLNPNLIKPQSIEHFTTDLSPISTALQHYYIAANKNPVGQKFGLDKADDNSEYSKVHELYHPLLRSYAEKFNYYDIFLVDAKSGNIVYSVSKEIDFASSLLTGPYKDSNLAAAFKASLVAEERNFSLLVDFDFYEPSYAAPASFISSPIFDDDERIGVLIFQMPIDKINSIMTSSEKWELVGMGKTGESYLVGSDRTMRSISRFLKQTPADFFQRLDALGLNKSVLDKIKLLSTTILTLEVDTETVREALKGNTGVSTLDNYQGRSVLSSYSPVNIGDVSWGIISELENAEAFSPVMTLIQISLVTILIIAVLLVLFSFLITRVVMRSIDKTVASVEQFLVEKPINLRNIAATAEGNESDKIAIYFNELVVNLQKDIERIAHVEKTLQDLKHLFGVPITGVFAVFSDIEEHLIKIKADTEKNRDAITDAVDSLIAGAIAGNPEAVKNLKDAKYSIIELSLKISSLHQQFEKASKAVKQIDASASTMLSSLSKITKKYQW